MAFWQKPDEPLRRFLARVETLEPTWTLFDPSVLGTDERVLESSKIGEDSVENYLGHKCEHRVITNSAEDWAITMTFRQTTPDGELTTTINTRPDSCWLQVKVGNVTLEELRYSATGYLSSDKISRYDVQYVRDWVRLRVLPALEAARQRRAMQEDVKRREHAATVAALRDKYLG